MRFVKMKVKLNISTGFAGADYEGEVEIDDSELEGMSEVEKENYINEEYVEQFLHEHIDAWYEEITD